MKNLFSTSSTHHITEANINYYATPFVHPKRKMNEHDFIYLLQGEWEFGQNDEVFDVKKDHLLILAAENLHFGLAPCSPATKTMYFHVSKNPSDALVPNDYIANKNEACTDIIINVQGNKIIKKLFSETVNQKLLGNERKSDLYFELLLCELSEYNIYGENIGIATKIKNVIHANPEKFFTNKELATKMNVSVKTAETKFKSVHNKTIHQYILDFKIREAISYMDLFEDISIKEVAYNLGFYDEYHFSKQFKKIMGISPGLYKKQMK